MPRLRASSLKSERVTLFFVETYDPEMVAEASAALGKAMPVLLRLSLVEGRPEVNDLRITVPPEIRWWAS